MTVAEQERQRYQRYQEQLPGIVDALEAGEDARNIAARIAETGEISLVDGYRWIQHTEEEIDTFRRRRAMVYLIPLWIAGVLFVAFGLMLLGDIGLGRTAGAGVGAVGSLAGASIATLVAWRRSRNPWHDWLQRQQPLQKP